MSLFSLLKLVHVGCALLSVGGFALRGYWALVDNPRRRSRLARVGPHVVDTLLLGSAVGMLVLWGVSPFSTSWLVAKLVALLLYIGLGMATLRFARTPRWQRASYTAALGCAAYIICVAVTHSPLGPLALLAG